MTSSRSKIYHTHVSQSRLEPSEKAFSLLMSETLSILVILSFKIPKVSFGIFVEIEKAYSLLRSDLWIGNLIRLLYNLDVT